jgi:ATP phosphoribosyltransferase
LRVIGEPLFTSNAGLFVHPGYDEAPQLKTLRNRVEGKLVAYEYMMVEYDVPGNILQQACEITPGLESPTITKLQREGWYAVKAMVLKREANRLMDELSGIGCRGILLTSIESARI